MPIGFAVSIFCQDNYWTHPADMHRRCRGRFLHHRDGDGTKYRAVCTCPCHLQVRAVIPPLDPAAEREPGET